jgi:hypothetical protein
VLATIEIGVLADVVWESLVAGVFVSVAFSVVVLGSSRSAEARRAGRAATATAYAGLALVAMAAFGALVAYGVHVILSKS